MDEKRRSKKKKQIKAIFVPVMYNRNNSEDKIKTISRKWRAYRVCVPCAGALHGGRLASGRQAFEPAWAAAGASIRRKGPGRVGPRPFGPQVLWSAGHDQSLVAPKRWSPHPADNAGCWRRSEDSADAEPLAQPLCKVL